MTTDVVKSEWSNKIYPCTNDQCDFIGLLDAFKFGSCYKTCPKCGSAREAKTGRFLYKRVIKKWLGLKYSMLKFTGVEWHITKKV